LICPRALSPTTPGGPMAAYARCFATGDGLHRSLAGWPLSTCVTRPNRVRFRYGSRVRSAGLRHRGSLRGPPALLPVERAINRATSFHVARPTSLILAHQRRREEDEKNRVLCCRGMGILPMIPTGPASGGMPCGGGFFAVKGTAGASRAQDTLPRNAGQDAGGTRPAPRGPRAVRLHPQPPVSDALQCPRFSRCSVRANMVKAATRGN